MDNLSNKSPLRYPGGKTKACKIIDEIINIYFDLSKYDTLISPFFGGGSFEFYFQNKYKKKIIANDKFTPLINFWLQIKKDKNILCDELKKVLNISKDDFILYRNNILNLNNNILQQAIYYFIINRCSFSGSTLSGGFSEESSKKRYTLSSIERINNLNLNYIDFYNLNFEIFLNNNFNNLLFIDPPYYINNNRLYGNKGDLHEDFDHQKLFTILNDIPDWILTYNDCEYIKNLYKKYIIIDVNWSYSMNKTKKSSEIIIISRSIN
jgi:DNA adenine methylase